jgi:putative DNA primase/helicase
MMRLPCNLPIDDLRYVAAWSRWLSYDGSRWQFDDTLKAFDLARKICRATAARCNKPKIATLVTSAKTVAAVERLAKADRRIAATVDQFDADPWLLNTPGGVVDLRNGKICPHRADDYLSKITNVAPDSNCSISLWKDFLQVVTNKDHDLIGYLQRLSGYSLTGITIEHILAFLWGTGANGKSTFIDAITQCLGDYHRTAPIETFTATYSDRHPTDLAGLRGARLVTAVETEEGRHWAESKIKTLTGGDKISARFMRQDFFEYVPQFKLVIAMLNSLSLNSSRVVECPPKVCRDRAICVRQALRANSSRLSRPLCNTGEIPPGFGTIDAQPLEYTPARC